MPGGGSGGNLANVSGRLHMSDMGLQRTGVTSQTGYQMGQNSLSGGGGGYGAPSGGVAAIGARQGKRRVSMNEMHLVSMDGFRGGSSNQVPPHTAASRPQRKSFDGGVPIQHQHPAQSPQRQQSPMTNGPVQQQYQPYPQSGGPSQAGGGQTHQQMPPPSQGPAGPIMSTTTVSAPLPLPPNSMAMTPTSAGAQNGYYPPTATAGQIQGYPPPPPGVMSTPAVMSAPQSNPGVISAPQQHQYPVQGGVSGAVSSHVNTMTTYSSSGTRKRGDPLPYATVNVSKTSPQHHHNRPGQTGQTGTRTSPGSMGRGGTGGGGAAVLSKLPTSPSRQASVTHSSTGNRPREVVTVSSPATGGGSYHYDQLPPQRSRNMAQQPMMGGGYPGYQPQGNISCSTMMAAPPPTKFTNMQLHQQYHQQYMKLQKQGSKISPYHVPTGGGGTRPTIQQYQEYAQYQEKQQREQPPVAPKKSPPKHHQHSSQSQPHPHGQSLQYSPHHSTGQGGMPIIHHCQQYQPNNAANSTNSSPGRPLHVQVNDTNARESELIPKPNSTQQQQISSPHGKQFEPQSTQAYDTLPAESDSLTNLDGSLVSVTDELDRFTEEMSKALEQFDSLLQPQTSEPLKHSAL